MMWTLLGTGALAVTSTAGLVLTSFDLASWEGTLPSNRSEAVDQQDGGEV
jgi:hypothetical protein